MMPTRGAPTSARETATQTDRWTSSYLPHMAMDGLLGPRTNFAQILDQDSKKLADLKTPEHPTAPAALMDRKAADVPNQASKLSKDNSTVVSSKEAESKSATVGPRSVRMVREPILPEYDSSTDSGEFTSDIEERRMRRRQYRQMLNGPLNPSRKGSPRPPSNHEAQSQLRQKGNPSVNRATKSRVLEETRTKTRPACTPLVQPTAGAQFDVRTDNHLAGVQPEREPEVADADEQSMSPAEYQLYSANWHILKMAKEHRSRIEEQVKPLQEFAKKSSEQSMDQRLSRLEEQVKQLEGTVKELAERSKDDKSIPVADPQLSTKPKTVLSQSTAVAPTAANLPTQTAGKATAKVSSSSKVFHPWATKVKDDGLNSTFPGWSKPEAELLAGAPLNGEMYSGVSCDSDWWMEIDAEVSAPTPHRPPFSDVSSDPAVSCFSKGIPPYDMGGLTAKDMQTSQEVIRVATLRKEACEKNGDSDEHEGSGNLGGNEEPEDTMPAPVFNRPFRTTSGSSSTWYKVGIPIDLRAEMPEVAAPSSLKEPADTAEPVDEAAKGPGSPASRKPAASSPKAREDTSKPTQVATRATGPTADDGAEVMHHPIYGTIILNPAASIQPLIDSRASQGSGRRRPASNPPPTKPSGLEAFGPDQARRRLKLSGRAKPGSLVVAPDSPRPGSAPVKKTAHANTLERTGMHESTVARNKDIDADARGTNGKAPKIARVNLTSDADDEVFNPCPSVNGLMGRCFPDPLTDRMVFLQMKAHPTTMIANSEFGAEWAKEVAAQKAEGASSGTRQHSQEAAGKSPLDVSGAKQSHLDQSPPKHGVVDTDTHLCMFTVYDTDTDDDSTVSAPVPPKKTSSGEPRTSKPTDKEGEKSKGKDKLAGSSASIAHKKALLCPKYIPSPHPPLSCCSWLATLT
jgi:hypothetical protein